MRKPKKPPKLPDILAKIQGDYPAFFKNIYSRNVTIQPENYFHWDKLIHLTPPEELNHEQWWRAIKLYRSSLYKKISLHDTDGNPFQFLVPDKVLEQLHKIDMSAGGMVAMPDQVTNPQTRDRYYINSLMEEAITSSQIEGAATTRKVAKEMIRSGRRPKDRSEQMILNNYKTMRQIDKLKNEPLSKEIVFKIHQIITANTLDHENESGRFRNPAEHVQVTDMYNTVLHDPPPADQLEDRVQAMCDFANNRSPSYFIHPVIRSIILHFWLAYDHPFVDGNGRVARALFYWSMLRHGFWMFEFISISSIILKAQSKYGRAFLYTETDDNDLTYFILYHLDIVQKAIEELHRYIQRKTEEIRHWESEIRSITLLNHRQRSLISHALRHPDQLYTFESHRQSHDVVYETSRNDILDLQNKGLLTGTKNGKQWIFRPVENLEKVLMNLT